MGLHNLNLYEILEPVSRDPEHIVAAMKEHVFSEYALKSLEPENVDLFLAAFFYRHMWREPIYDTHEVFQWSADAALVLNANLINQTLKVLNDGPFDSIRYVESETADKSDRKGTDSSSNKGTNKDVYNLDTKNQNDGSTRVSASDSSKTDNTYGSNETTQHGKTDTTTHDTSIGTNQSTTDNSTNTVKGTGTVTNEDTSGKSTRSTVDSWDDRADVLTENNGTEKRSEVTGSTPGHTTRESLASTPQHQLADHESGEYLDSYLIKEETPITGEKMDPSTLDATSAGTQKQIQDGKDTSNQTTVTNNSGTDTSVTTNDTTDITTTNGKQSSEGTQTHTGTDKTQTSGQDVRSKGGKDTATTTGESNSETSDTRNATEQRRGDVSHVLDNTTLGEHAETHNHEQKMSTRERLLTLAAFEKSSSLLNVIWPKFEHLWYRVF